MHDKQQPAQLKYSHCCGHSNAQAPTVIPKNESQQVRTQATWVSHNNFRAHCHYWPFSQVLMTAL